jgi:hypothetical protein
MILVHKAKSMNEPLPPLHPINGCAEPETSLENNVKFIQNDFARIENSFIHLLSRGFSQRASVLLKRLLPFCIPDFTFQPDQPIILEGFRHGSPGNGKRVPSLF